MPWFITWAVHSDPLPKRTMWRDGAKEQAYSTALRWLLPPPLESGSASAVMDQANGVCPQWK